MSSRAKRRHLRAYAVRRALIILDFRGWYFDEPVQLALAARKRADNLKICSCSMCCNKRRGFDTPKTRQELAHELALQEWLDEA